jgi:serine/threonine protein phosphatase PrpC
MNIIRRLFGRKTSQLDTPVAAADSEVQLIEEADAPHSMNIPGVTVEIDLTQNPELNVETAALGATRQLPTLESALTSPNQHVLFGHSSDVGMVRAGNQDALLTFFAAQSDAQSVPDFGLFVMADGMGGHHDGERASAIAAQVFAEQVTRRIYLPMLLQDADTEAPPLVEILIESVKTANDMVVKAVPEGGTTITAVALIGDLAYLAHVGDSRAYLITHEYGMEQVTRDHSLVQRLIELDQLTVEEAAQHPQKNVLYRALGQSEHLEVDLVTRRLPAQSYLLLCSDGLWNMVPETAIQTIVLDTKSPQAACDRLIAAANEYGGVDNISAILLHIPG